MQNKIQKIYLATDHAGFELKQKVKIFLQENYDFEIIDCGSYEYDEKDNYTDFIHKAGKSLSLEIKENGKKDEIDYLENNDQNIRAIVFGGSGEGEAMVMNRYKGIRCTTYYGNNLEIVELGRKHNDVNAISFGARFIDYDECIKAINIFLKTDFEGDRHVERIKNIEI
jgi:ribose 5-phosphate isomerase B